MLHPYFKQVITKDIDPVTGEQTLKPLPISEDEFADSFEVTHYSQYKDYTLVSWERGNLGGQTLYRGFKVIAHGGGALPLYQKAKPNKVGSQMPRPWTGTTESRIEGSTGIFGIPLNVAIALSDSRNSRRRGSTTPR